ncbi:MAG: acyltransferase [Burkholderiales bacterium]|nr:acyltransferase [Burkholderiales bacterium]
MPTSPTSTSSRIHGLDTLRACAIALVLMYHYMVFVSHESSFGIVSELGWAGVDLFFVLSGYLIGNQIMSAIQRNEAFSLKNFYLRRLLRTLPNYYVILALYFIFPLDLGGKLVTPLWKFLTFTENIGLRPGAAFSHAWSLCIEEQFYLILPALALLIARFGKSVKIGWLALSGLMLLALLTRMAMWKKTGHDWFTYYEHIYYSSYTRFDELLPGVAIAMLKNFHAPQWQTLQKHANKILLAGLALTLFNGYLFSNYQYTEEHGFLFFTNSFGYTLLPCGFALLTLSALSPSSWLNRWRIPGASQLALWSYAIYLAHKPLMNVLIAPMQKFGVNLQAPSGIALMMASGIAGGWLLYRLVETPFMHLRQRLVPSTSKASATLAPNANSLLKLE